MVAGSVLLAATAAVVVGVGGIGAAATPGPAVAAATATATPSSSATPTSSRAVPAPAAAPGRGRAPAPAAVAAAAPAPAAEPAPAPAADPAPAPEPAPPATPAPAPAAADGPLVAGTPCTASARACVDRGGRRAWLIHEGAVARGPVPVMVGSTDDPTPTGTFVVQWKAEQHTSREYLVQMPYSVFFADGGIAFHEGRQDTPSAGCVKLGHDDAVAWFGFLQVGDQVQVLP